ncbi:MAG TPA: preprotein translocase subunit SecE [Candidatus Saccharimonadales bacterium]|jgi:preprotein translocase SecE subunit
MADDKPVVPEGEVVDNTDKKPAKRRLRTNSETVRQRTEKFQQQQKNEAAPKSSFFGSFMRGFIWPLRQLGRLVGKLGRYRVFRIIGRILLPKYLRNSWRELRMVTWPNWRTSWKLTYAVIVFSIVFGVIVALVDFVLDKLFKELIIK